MCTSSAGGPSAGGGGGGGALSSVLTTVLTNTSPSTDGGSLGSILVGSPSKRPSGSSCLGDKGTRLYGGL